MTSPSKMSGPERDAVLAGLRLLQQELCSGNLSIDTKDIYTNCNEHMGLDLKDIDDLCERINI